MENPRVNHNIVIIKQTGGRALIFNKQTRKSFSIGKNEYEVLILCDGEHSMKEICNQSNSYPVMIVEKLLDKFKEIGILEDGQQKRTRIHSLQIGLLHPNEWLISKIRFVNIVSSIILYFSLPIYILGVIVISIHPFQKSIINKQSILGTIVLLFISMILHEIAHAVIAVNNGCCVVEIGVGLKGIIPCLYTNVTGMNHLEHKNKRLQIYGAGVLMNLFLCGIGLLGLYFGKGSILPYFSCLMWMNHFLVVINIFVYFKLDGYYMLQEVFNISNLQQNSIIYSMYLINSALFMLTRGKLYFGSTSDKKKMMEKMRESKRNIAKIHWWKKVFYIVYFIIGIGFMLFVIFSFINVFLWKAIVI